MSATTWVRLCHLPLGSRPTRIAAAAALLDHAVLTCGPRLLHGTPHPAPIDDTTALKAFASLVGDPARGEGAVAFVANARGLLALLDAAGPRSMSADDHIELQALRDDLEDAIAAGADL